MSKLLLKKIYWVKKNRTTYKTFTRIKRYLWKRTRSIQ